MKPIDRPLLPLACVLIVGIALGDLLPNHRVFFWGGVFGCFTGILAALYRRKPAVIFPLFFFLGLGYLLVQPWVAPKFGPHHITRYADKGPVTIFGKIDSSPVCWHRRQKFNFTSRYILHKEKKVTVDGKLKVTVSEDLPRLFQGDNIVIKGNIRLLRNFNNPGGFDYKRYMAGQGVWGSVYARADRLKVLGRDENRFQRAIFQSRRRVAAFIDTAASDRTLGVFKTLLLGDRSRLSEEIKMAFRKSGVAHLLAISGLHIGIVGSVAFFITGRILAFFPFLLWRGWVKRGAVIFALICVWGYGLIAGMSPSTQRAVCMISVFFLSFYVGRSPDLLNTLAAACIVILVIHPPSLFSVSFQLSYTAVVAIILGLEMFGKKVDGAKAGTCTKWRGKLFTFFLVSLYATLGTLPLIMLYFQQVSTIGLFSNLLFVPLIGFFVLPVGFVAVIVSSVNSVFATWIFLPADRLLAISLDLVEKMAAWPVSSFMTVTPSNLEVLLYYFSVLLLVGYIKCKQRDREEIISRSHKSLLCLYYLGASICFFVVLTDIGYWRYYRFWHKDLRVSVIDVGHGSANLIELPGGKVILVDGGGFSDNAVFDVGKNVVAPFLRRKKILTVDEIILSHPNSDHLNGLLYIAANFGVKRLWCNNESVETKGYRQLTRLVKEKHIVVPDYCAAPKTEIINNVILKFLYPPADYMGKRKTEQWRNTNNNSLVVQVRFGAYTFLFPGDIEGPAEKELVSIEGDALKSDVLIAPHHGSKTSGTTAFLQKVRPEIVVFSTGGRKWQKRPHPEALVRYRRTGARLYNTETHGALCFSTNGRRLVEGVTK